MILKVDKKFDDLEIGIVGERKSILSEVLRIEKTKFTELGRTEEITDKYDLVFGSGIYSIIGEQYISAPKYGVVFFHETHLPEGKGNAPIQWTVENGKSNLTVTAFRAAKKMDAGDYLYQHNIGIEATDGLNELEIKRTKGIQECFKVVLSELKQGYIVLRKQSGKASVSPKRTPKDSGLDPNLPLIELWDKIRTCDNDRFPAFFSVDGAKIYLRYKIEGGTK